MSNLVNLLIDFGTAWLLFKFLCWIKIQSFQIDQVANRFWKRFQWIAIETPMLHQSTRQTIRSIGQSILERTIDCHHSNSYVRLKYNIFKLTKLPIDSGRDFNWLNFKFLCYIQVQLLQFDQFANPFWNRFRKNHVQIQFFQINQVDNRFWNRLELSIQVPILD